MLAFIESLKRSAKSLRNACNNAKRHVDGAAASAAAAAAASECSAQKDAAEKAKSEVERRAKVVPATYQLRNTFPASPTSPFFVGDWDLSNPCFFSKESVEGLQEFKNDLVLQLMFVSFGGYHKKTSAFQEAKMCNCLCYFGKGLGAVNQ